MKQETITVFQDYQNPVQQFEEHKQNLYALRDIIGNEHFNLQADGTLQIMHYVGFFQRGNTRIQILPKIYYKHNKPGDNKDESTASLNFLYRLLYWSGYLNQKNLPPQFQNVYDSDLLEIFISIFISEFIKLYKNKSHRNYIQEEENLQFIRGKILFTETLRRNPLTKHLHYIRYDEFTTNNQLNQIFKSLIVDLLKKTNNSKNKRDLNIGLSYLQDIDLINLSPAVFKQVKFDRLNAEFEPLFNLAKLFFNNLQPGLSYGKEKTFSFLIKLNSLFQAFVGIVLKEVIKIEPSCCIDKSTIHLGKHNDVNVFKLIPDFKIFHKGKSLCILDAKFKSPFDEAEKVRVEIDDLYQLVTYAVGFNCRELYLIYPKFLGVDTESLLASYVIMSPYGQINLRILQTDIMHEKLNSIVEELRPHIMPNFS